MQREIPCPCLASRRSSFPGNPGKMLWTIAWRQGLGFPEPLGFPESCSGCAQIPPQIPDRPSPSRHLSPGPRQLGEPLLASTRLPSPEPDGSVLREPSSGTARHLNGSWRAPPAPLPAAPRSRLVQHRGQLRAPLRLPAPAVEGGGGGGGNRAGPGAWRIPHSP